MERDFNQLAEALIAKQRFEEAETVLQDALREMPGGWKPVQADGESVQVAFWDEEEFSEYVQHEPSSASVSWLRPSYSRAWYTLGALAFWRKRFEQALFCLDSGIQLEPDHPELWTERGHVLARLERHEEALACYARAATGREWAPATQIARALRAQGVQLADLGRIDEAEAALKQSLEFDPENDLVRQRLEDLEQLLSAVR